MAQGVYRTEDAWAMVDFGNNVTTLMAKWRYEESGIRPPFSQLPLLSQYIRTKAKDHIPSPSRDDEEAA